MYRLAAAMILVSTCMLFTGQALAADKVFGAGVSAPDTMLISEILANPEKYVGETVRVEGLAVDVCVHRGCWVNLASDVEGDVVRFKVTDGEMVFLPEILGDLMIAEGVWTANELDLETTRRVCAYEAEEKGEKFDPESVTSCKTLYQITGTGAIVHEAAQGNQADAAKSERDAEARPNSQAGPKAETGAHDS